MNLDSDYSIGLSKSTLLRPESNQLAHLVLLKQNHSSPTASFFSLDPALETADSLLLDTK